MFSLKANQFLTSHPMFLTRNHHPLCTGCCGNYIGVGHLMKAWETEIHHLPLQTITLSSHRADDLWEHEWTQTVLCVLVHIAFTCSSHSKALQRLWTWCRHYVVTRKHIEFWFEQPDRACWIAFQTAILVFILQSGLLNLGWKSEQCFSFLCKFIG